jgi:hypothetical protein
MKERPLSDQSAPHGAEGIGACYRASMNQTALIDILPGQVGISALNAKKADLVPTPYEYD